jgi:2-hydroxychromene-2-carboxylate isomerase
VKGHRPDDPKGFSAIVEALAFEGGDSVAKEKVATAVVKQELLENGADALAEKVFGVPTIIAQGELFWGVDSLDMLLHFLDNPNCYSDDEMSRIFSIVPSASRVL